MSHICANCGASLIEGQALCTACGELANRPDKTQLRPRVSLPDIVDFWWLGIPRKLRRYSRLLWAAWSDGIYLTSFPRMAVAFPIVLLLFGFFQGATHWSPVTIDSNALNTTIPAVTFAQILHLLFIAALLGSMSADLGLMIVVGYALGDYLVAGPFFRFGPWAPVSGFFSYRVPQLFTYWIFLSLAVAPTVAANGLLTPVRRWLPRDNTASVLGRVAASAVVQGLLVYLWIPLATVTVRIVWAWVQQTPPLDVADYIRMLNPWLPLAAGVGVILRATLVRLTRGDQQLKQRIKQLQEDAVEADRDPAWPRRLPVWLRAVFSGAASTVLLSGLISNEWSAIVVGGGLVGVCLLRSSWLPKLAWWMKWIDTIERIPLIFRLASTTVITYYLTLGLLQLPGSSPGLNPKAGQFQAELACLGAGLLIMIVLMPFVPAGPSEMSGPKRALALSPAAASVVRNACLFLVAGLMLFVGAPAYAICLDPVCCFGSPANAALAVACLLLVLALFAIGGAAIAALVAFAEGAAEAAALGEGTAALADVALADTALGGGGGAAAAFGEGATAPALANFGLADTALGNAVSPFAPTVAPLAPTVNMVFETAAAGPTLGQATAVIMGSATFGYGAGMAGASLIGDSGTGSTPSGNGPDTTTAQAQAQAQAAEAQAEAEAQAQANQAEQQAIQAQAEAQAQTALAQAQATETANAQAQLQAAQAQAQVQAQAQANQAEQQSIQAQAEADAQTALAQATAGQSTSTATSPLQTTPVHPGQGSYTPVQPVQGLTPPQPIQGLTPAQPVQGTTSSSTSGSSGSSHS